MRNGLDQSLTIDSLRYQVFGVNGQIVRSTSIPPFRPVVVAPGKSANVLFRFAKALPAGRRSFVGDGQVLPLTLERRRVLYRVFGHTGHEARVVLRRFDLVGFKPVRRCGPI